MSFKRVSRRKFVGEVAAAGLGINIVPRQALGHGFQAPSDKLNVACIGIGGMGRSDVRGVSDENIYALCDVDEKSAAYSFNRYPKAKRFKDFRVMLEQEEKNIDAVTVSTPDHTHAAAAMMAMKMGKHVYCQKPLARTLHEVRALEKVAAQTGIATQMGNQGHAGDGTRELREWIEGGAIGTVREVHYWTDRPIWPQGIDRPLESYPVPAQLDWDLWLGPAHERPYHPAYAPFKWRAWWDFGTGALGDIACHSMDAAFWILGLGYPERIEAESTSLFPECAPKASRIVYDFPARRGRPPVKLLWRDGSFGPTRPEGVGDDLDWPTAGIGGQLWIGDDGALLAGTYGGDPKLLDEARDQEFRASPPPEKYPRSPGVYDEWINACKGGPPAGSTFEGHAGPLTEMVLLGNLALRAGRVVRVNSRNGKIRNTDIPRELIEPEYRNGWSL